MAGDEIGDRVGGDGATDRTGGARHPQRPRQRLVGDDPAGRDAQQRLPHLELEVRAGNRQPERRAGGHRSREDARRDRLGGLAVLAEAGGGPAPLEPDADRFGVRVCEAQGADAARGQTDQARAEGARVHAIDDVDAGAAALEGTGAHRLAGDEEIVQPAGAGKARVVGGVEDGGRVGEPRLRVVEGQELAEALGRNPRPTPEQALEMPGTQADLPRHVAELRLIAKMALQPGDRGLDPGVVAGVPLDVHPFKRHGAPPETGA